MAQICSYRLGEQTSGEVNSENSLDKFSPRVIIYP